MRMPWLEMLHVGSRKAVVAPFHSPSTSIFCPPRTPLTSDVVHPRCRWVVPVNEEPAHCRNFPEVMPPPHSTVRATTATPFRCWYKLVKHLLISYLPELHDTPWPSMTIASSSPPPGPVVPPLLRPPTATTRCNQRASPTLEKLLGCTGLRLGQ
jgi:hypothetical protein